MEENKDTPFLSSKNMPMVFLPSITQQPQTEGNQHCSHPPALMSIWQFSTMGWNLGGGLGLL